jgi:hypothetical protein
MRAATVKIDIQSLVGLEEYRSAGRSSVFPSKASLDWFIRRHKDALLAAGALVSPTGRKLILPEAFDGVVSDLALLTTNRTAGGGE